MQVLVALAQAQGAVVSRDSLIARCWEGGYVGEDAINRAIWRLRKLAESGGDFAVRDHPPGLNRLPLSAWPILPLILLFFLPFSTPLT
jgi:hypothetical protein